MRRCAPDFPASHPGYDEYRYNLAEINHNPYVLTSYLTVKYEDYTRAEVQSELQALFDKQYELELEEEVEIRTRTETRTGTTSYTDPETGESYCDHMLDLVVAGILETGGSEEEFVYITYADAAFLTLEDRGYDVVEVSVAQMQDQLQKYVNTISENVDGVAAKLVKRVTASESSVLTKLQSLVFIVTAVVLILTMICVATTMAAVIAERRKEIGLRKAIGASDSSIVKEFLGESMMLGGLGGVLGSVLGFIFAQQVSIHVFSSSISFMPALVPITILVSVLVTGLSSLMPIRSATEGDPALVLKGE